MYIHTANIVAIAKHCDCFLCRLVRKQKLLLQIINIIIIIFYIMLIDASFWRCHATKYQSHATKYQSHATKYRSHATKYRLIKQRVSVYFGPRNLHYK